MTSRMDYAIRIGGTNEFISKIDPDDRRCCPPGSADSVLGWDNPKMLRFSSEEEAKEASDLVGELEGIHTCVETVLPILEEEGMSSKREENSPGDLAHEIHCWMETAAGDIYECGVACGGEGNYTSPDDAYEEWQDWAMDHIDDELRKFKTKAEFMAVIYELKKLVPSKPDVLDKYASQRCAKLD